MILHLMQANLARWEPRHGRFGFRHPWKQYLKIGSLSRQCAYQIEALDAYINSHNQVIYHGIVLRLHANVAHV